MYDPEPLEAVVKETYLSRKPSGASWYAALLSCLALVSASWVYSSRGPALAANGDLVFQKHQYWKLLTTIFVHSGPDHLFSNLLPYFFLSYILFGHFGWLVYPVLTLIFGALVNAATLHAYPPGVYLVGASGVVYLMSAFWLMIYILVEKRHSLAKRILRASAITFIFLLPASFHPAVSYRAHAIGFGVGIVFAIVYYLFRRNTFLASLKIEYE